MLTFEEYLQKSVPLKIFTSHATVYLLFALWMRALKVSNTSQVKTQLWNCVLKVHSGNPVTFCLAHFAILHKERDLSLDGYWQHITVMVIHILQLCHNKEPYVEWSNMSWNKVMQDKNREWHYIILWNRIWNCCRGMNT